MQYNLKHPQTHVPSSLFEQLRLKTKQELSVSHYDRKTKLLPILQSKNIFMISLIREEQNTNRPAIPKIEEQSKIATIASQALLNPKHQSPVQSSLKLVPKQGSLIFNNQKFKRKHILTCPSDVKPEEDEKKESSKVLNDKSSKESRFYSKKREKNSLHFDINSHSMVQLLQRIESLKRLFDTKNNMYKRQKKKDVSQKINENHVLSPSFFHKSDEKGGKKINWNPKSERMLQNLQSYLRDIDEPQTSRKTLSKYSPKAHNYREEPNRKVLMVDKTKIDDDYLFNPRREKKKKITNKTLICEEQLNPWKSQYPLELEQTPFVLD